MKGDKTDMLGKSLNGYEIIACAYVDGNEDKEIAILAKRPNEEKYVTGLMNQKSDIEWYWGHYHENWDASERSWQDFVKRANTNQS